MADKIKETGAARLEGLFSDLSTSTRTPPKRITISKSQAERIRINQKCYGFGKSWAESQRCVENEKAKKKWSEILLEQTKKNPTKHTGFAAKVLEPIHKRFMKQVKYSGTSESARKELVKREIIKETVTPETHPGGFIGALDRIGNTASDVLGHTTQHIIEGVGDIVKVVQPYLPYILGALVGGEYIGAAVGGAEAGETAAAGGGTTAAGAGAAGGGGAAATGGGAAAVGGGAAAVGGGGASTSTVAGGVGAGGWGLSSLFSAPKATGAQALGSTAVTTTSTSTLGEIGGGLSYLGSLVSPSSGSTGSTLLNLGGKLLSGSGGIAGFLGNLVSFIATAINGIAKFAEDVNKNLIDKFVRPIVDTIDMVKSLTQVIHGDLSEGLQGLIKIPQQISFAMENEAAVLRRTGLETLAGQAEIVKHLMLPGFNTVASEPIGQLNNLIGQYTAVPEDEIEDNLLVNLKEPPDYLGVVSQAESFLNKITNDKSFIGRFFFYALQLIYYAPVGAMSAMAAEQQMQQNVNAKNQLEILGIGDVVTAQIRGEISDAQAEEEVAKHGLDKTRLELLNHIKRPLLSPGDIITAQFRRILSKENADKELNRIGFTDDRITALIELHTLLPQPPQAMQWFARSGLSEADLDMILEHNGYTADQTALFKRAAYTPMSGRLLTQTVPRISAVEDGYINESLESKPPDSVYEQYDKNLLSRKQADLDWLAHWDDFGIGQWIRGYFRNVISRPELDTALKAHAVPKELNDLAIEVNRELIPIWLIPAVMSGGQLTDEQTGSMFRKLGLDEENVTIMIEYGRIMKDNKQAHNAVKLHQLSVSNLQNLYKTGVIDDTKFIAGLVKHGYSSTDAELILDLTKVSEDIKAREEKVNEIIAEVNVHLITKQEGIDKLFALGFSDGEVAKFVTRLYKERVTRYKLPSEVQLNNMLKYSVISPEEWMEGMRAHGYSENWTGKLFDLLKASGKLNVK